MCSGFVTSHRLASSSARRRRRRRVAQSHRRHSVQRLRGGYATSWGYLAWNWASAPTFPMPTRLRTVYGIGGSHTASSCRIRPRRHDNVQNEALSQTSRNSRLALGVIDAMGGLPLERTEHGSALPSQCEKNPPRSLAVGASSVANRDQSWWVKVFSPTCFPE